MPLVQDLTRGSPGDEGEESDNETPLEGGRRHPNSYCSVTEKPDVMVLAPVMVLAYVMVDGEADMVVNKEADIVVDDVADMEVDKVADMEVDHGGRRGG